MADKPRVEKESPETLLARMALMEQNFAVMKERNAQIERKNELMEEKLALLTKSEAEEPKESEPEEGPKVEPTYKEKVMAKMQEHYKVQATALVATATSFDLLSKFELNTAAFIALLALLIKVSFALVFTHFETRNCVPSRTVLDGDWKDGYTSIFSKDKRQFLCGSWYLDDFQFRVGNQQFRENWDLGFGWEDAYIDLSNWDYDYVWPGRQGMLKAKVTGQSEFNTDAGEMNAIFNNDTTWYRILDLDQKAHYVGQCAEQCAFWGSNSGFHAHNALTKEWECVCANLDNDNYCSANYTDHKSRASRCFLQSHSKNSSKFYEESYFVWNDTYYHVQPFVFFSKQDLDSFDYCSENATWFEGLCPDKGTPQTQKGGPPKRADLISFQNPNDPDGVYWSKCTLKGFTCDDYQHERCAEYGHYGNAGCGYQGPGAKEIPCSGLVSVGYMTCPSKHIVFGSSLGYLSYLELVVVTIMICFFLWHRGENPWEFFKANMIALIKAGATEYAKKEVAKLTTEFKKTEKKEMDKVGAYAASATGDDRFQFDNLKSIYEEEQKHKGIQGTWEPAVAPLPFNLPGSNKKSVPKPQAAPGAMTIQDSNDVDTSPESPSTSLGNTDKSSPNKDIGASARTSSTNEGIGASARTSSTNKGIDASGRTWTEYTDPHSGDKYYADESGRTTWDKPPFGEVIAGKVEPKPSKHHSQKPNKSSLPRGWSSHRDHYTGEKYYLGPNGQRQRARPIEEEQRSQVKGKEQERGGQHNPDKGNISREEKPLPKGWRSVVDDTTGKTYYYNHNTKESSWKRPPF